MKILDLIGRRFNKLIVVEQYPKSEVISRTGRRRCVVKLLCLCDCGRTTLVVSQNLTRGNTKSCGCWKAEAPVTRSKHGLARTIEYRLWCKMKARCNNKNNPGYKDYGGRGIWVCPEWDHSFEAFYNDMGPRPSKKHSLERTNNDEGYSKSNTIWATKKEQARNTRVTIRVLYNGKLTALADVADSEKLPLRFLYQRIRSGWTIQEALKYPPQTKIKTIRKNVTIN